MADVTGPGIRFPIIADTADFIKGADKALQKAKATAEKARAMGMAMAAAGAAITAAFAVGMKKAVEFGTSIDRMAEATGIAHEKISKLAFAAGQYHGSQEALQKSMKRLAYAMAETKDGAAEYKDEFDKLGIAVVDSSGKLRAIDDVFYELSDKLSTLGDDTQALALAQKILGRSGEGLLPIMKKGGDALREQGELAGKLGLVLDSKTSKALETLGTTVGNIKKAVLGFVTTGLKPLITDATELAQRVVDVIAKLTAWTKEHPKLTGFLGKTAVALGGVLTVVGTGILLFPKLAAAIKAVALAMHTPPLGLIAIIATVITLLITFRKEVWNALQKAWHYVSAFGAKISEYVLRFVNTILGAFEKLPLVGKKIAALRENVENAAEGLERFKDRAMHAAGEIKILGNKAKEAGEEGAEGIKAIGTAIDDIATKAAAMPGAIADAGEKTKEALESSIETMNQMRASVQEAVESMFASEEAEKRQKAWTEEVERRAKKLRAIALAGAREEAEAELLLMGPRVPPEALRKHIANLAAARAQRATPGLDVYRERARLGMAREAPSGEEPTAGGIAGGIRRLIAESGTARLTEGEPGRPALAGASYIDYLTRNVMAGLTAGFRSGGAENLEEAFRSATDVIRDELPSYARAAIERSWNRPAGGVIRAMEAPLMPLDAAVTVNVHGITIPEIREIIIEELRKIKQEAVAMVGD